MIIPLYFYVHQVPLEYEPPKLVKWFQLPRFIRVLRHKLYLYMEEPTSSKTALVLNVFLTICNIASVITYCLESIPINNGDGVSTGVWYAWEICLMTIFTLELICRAPAHTSLRQFVFRRPGVFVDFFACIPFDFYLFGLHWGILDTRWLRPIRLLRIVSFGYLVFDLKLILTGIRRSVWMIALVWCLALLFLFCFASVLFMAERGPWDSGKNCYLDSDGVCAKFDSVPTSLYFCLEVVSSLGYGDIVPTKAISLWITMILMLVSVSILATIVAVFSVQFDIVYQRVKRTIHIESLKEAADLQFRMAVFQGGNKQQLAVREAACRLATSAEILEAICKDLSETMKKIRADLVFLSQTGTKGARAFNPILASKKLGRKQRLARVVEKSLADLAATAYNDCETLSWVTLNTAEELFVSSVQLRGELNYELAESDSP